jgi:hypothetical protein
MYSRVSSDLYDTYFYCFEYVKILLGAYEKIILNSVRSTDNFSHLWRRYYCLNKPCNLKIATYVEFSEEAIQYVTSNGYFLNRVFLITFTVSRFCHFCTEIQVRACKREFLFIFEDLRALICYSRVPRLLKRPLTAPSFGQTRGNVCP